MARTKQTARKCSGPPAGKPLSASASRDKRPTGKAYLEALSEYAAQSQNSHSSSQGPVAAEDGAAQHSIAEKPTALPELGPDLLQRVFAALGPHPKDLVPLGAVCRQWRQVLSERTWKELCEKHAPGLVEQLGYNVDGAHVPASSWAALYKLLVYCPGCHFPSFQPVLNADALSERYEWVHGHGHVQTELQGFCKGEGAKEALYLATSDEIVVSRLCSHHQATEMCDILEASAPPILACRGIVKGFAGSELAKLSGVAAFLSQEKGSKGVPSEPAEVAQEMDTGAAIAKLDPDGAKGEKVDDDGALDEGADSEAEDFEEYSSGSKAESEADSEDDDASDVEATEGKAPPCPFCGKLTFALPQEAFPGTQFTDYDDLLSESFRDGYDRHHREGIYEGLEPPDSDEDLDDAAFALMTGFVCLDGHIVLGAAGYPKKDAPGMPGSGQGLHLLRPEAIEYLLDSVVVKDLDLKEGQRFIRGLEFDQLIQIEERLSMLKAVWPVEGSKEAAREGKEDIEEVERKDEEDKKLEESAPFKTFGSLHVRDNAPVGIVTVMRASVPADLLKALHDFVLTGKPSLAECEQSILDAFEMQERMKAEAAARACRSEAMHRDFCVAGFMSPRSRDVPPDLSKVWQDFVRTGNPSLGHCELLLREACETLKQEKEKEEARRAGIAAQREAQRVKTKAQRVLTEAQKVRKEAIYGALREAGIKSYPVPHLESVSTYIEGPTAITIADVISQQMRAREERNMCRVVIEGTLCANPAAKACSNGGCGNCCHKAPVLCRLSKHRKSS